MDLSLLPIENLKHSLNTNMEGKRTVQWWSRLHITTGCV